MKRKTIILIFLLNIILGNIKVFAQNNEEIKIFNDFLSQIEYFEIGYMNFLHHDIFEKILNDTNYSFNLEKFDSIFIKKESKNFKKCRLIIYDSLFQISSKNIKEIKKTVRNSKLVPKCYPKKIFLLNKKKSFKISRSDIKNESAIIFEMLSDSSYNRNNDQGNTFELSGNAYLSRIYYNSNYAMLTGRIRGGDEDLFLLRKREDGRWIISKILLLFRF